MNEIIEILIKRDDMPYEEARKAVTEFLAEAEPFIENGDYEGLEEILRSELGLDPDYIPTILGY